MSFIETERLLLRTWMPGDAETWYRVASNPQMYRYLAAAPPPTQQGVRAWIDAQMDEQDREGFSCWPVIRKEDGALIGRCGLHRLPDGDVEIACAFDPAVWGRGYASEAAAAVLTFARDGLHLHRIVALADPRNRDFIALVNRLQMRFDRVTRVYRRDLLRYCAGA